MQAIQTSSNRETEARDTAQEPEAGKGAAMPQKGDLRKLGHQGWHRRVEMGQRDHRMGREVWGGVGARSKNGVLGMGI